VCVNPQLVNGRLWSQEDFVEAVFTEDDETVEEIIRNEVPIATDSVLNGIRETIRSTKDQLEEFRTVTDISAREAYHLRQHAAERQFQLGNQDPTEELLAAAPDGVTETAVRNFLIEPDVDGCVENLQLKYNIIAGDQSDVLSYLVLEQLHEFLTTDGGEDWGEDMINNQAIPGANIDGSNVFHTL